MTLFDRALQLFCVALALVIAWQLARALIRREVRRGGRIYGRTDRPVDHRSAVAFSAICVAMLVWAIATWDEQRSSRAWQLLLVVFFGLPAGFSLLSSLKRGVVRISGLEVDRRHEPRQYWAWILGHVALIAIFIWSAIMWQAARPRDRYDDVEPVVAAVRRAPPEGMSGEVAAVRVDSRSRLVCGEVRQTDGKALRFFAADLKTGAQVTLEKESLPKFSGSYARVCGSPVLPRNGG